MYQCPEGYVYWDVSRRCELISRVPKCKRGEYRSVWGTSQVPLETQELGYTSQIVQSKTLTKKG